MPHGTAATTYTATAIAADSSGTRSRFHNEPVPVSNSTTPATTIAGTDNALIDAAAPAARPTHSASSARGLWSRVRSASATARTERATDGPSALTGPVTHSTDPLVVTSPAASHACVRVVIRRAHEYVATVTRTPAEMLSNRGALSVRKPKRSATHTSG